MASTSSGSSKTSIDLSLAIKGVLSSIDREREREIVSRRFGLDERKETLEQIGELLGITRERVRQLEKTVLTRLKTNANDGKLASIVSTEKAILNILAQNNNLMRTSDLAHLITNDNNRANQSRLLFMAELAPGLSVLEESDLYYSTIANRTIHDEKKVRELTNSIVDTVSQIGEPATIEKIAKTANIDDVSQVMALAKISKYLSELNGQWGLTKWPTVNPRNIRDKIYVILSEHKSHMHFNEIAETIRKSDFKRKSVTTQAIHNELIKDSRFILIGRGIYALKEWGYQEGTVSDMITEVLREAQQPLHRDEIVARVLKTRHVKETTILLNLQGKPQFKRTAKATYTLADTVTANIK